KAFDLKLLADPARVFPPYDAILLLSPAAARRPALVSALRPLIGAIDQETMQEANRRGDVEKQSPRDAAGWRWGGVRSLGGGEGAGGWGNGAAAFCPGRGCSGRRARPWRPLAGLLVHRPGRADAGGGSHLPALLAVRRSGRATGPAGRLPHRRGGRPAGGRGP